MDGDPQRSAKLLSEQLTIASNKSIASLKGVGKFLERNDEVMRTVVAMTPPMPRVGHASMRHSAVTLLKSMSMPYILTPTAMKST